MSPEPRRAGEAGGPWPHGRSPAAAAKVAAFLMSLRSLGVRDLALLSAVERTQREAFLPPGLGELAYVNVALPISCGQTAFTPKEMIQRIAVMQVERRHNILEVGAGSGYQTALLSALAKRVHAVERYRALAGRAAARLSVFGLANAAMHHADGREGLAQSAPYDRIFINARLGAFPQVILGQLAEGGRVLAAIGDTAEAAFVMRVKTGDSFTDAILGRSGAEPLESGLPDVL